MYETRFHEHFIIFGSVKIVWSNRRCAFRHARQVYMIQCTCANERDRDIKREMANGVRRITVGVTK